MKRILMAGALLLIAISLVYGQAIPPVNLAAELVPGGQVNLSWDPPPEGMFEDFEDGLAQDFDWDVSGSYVIEDGFAKINSGGTWSSGVYTGVDFDDFSAEVTFQNQSGIYSRGLLFRADGPMTSNQYAFWVAYSLYNGAYGVWRYGGGGTGSVIYWVGAPDVINTGAGEFNTLRVEVVGNNFDLYINDTFMATASDDDFTTGYVGIATAQENVVWFDEIGATFGVPVGAGDAEPYGGIPVTELYDDMGRPVDGQVSVEQPRLTSEHGPVSGNSSQRDIDEFVEYYVYRDGSMIGTTDLESYTDQLPNLGEHEYTVTAYYDPEGESSPAGPVVVNWEAVSLTLTGQITEIPAAGGTVVYDGTLTNYTGGQWAGVDYWTAVQLPNGQVFSPVDQINNFTVTPFMDVTVTGLSQDIPNIAPAGEYVLTGHIGFYPNAQLDDSFTFTKLGAVADGAIVFDPEQWRTGGDWSTVLAGTDPGNGVAGLPQEYALSAAYPNPFNPSTSFSVTLPETAELTVAVYNIRGQLVATLAEGITQAGTHEFSIDASGLATGLYFVRAFVPGELDQIRKVTLLR